MGDAKELWNQVYERGMTMWQPQESVVVFTARYLKRREDLEHWTIWRDARRILDLGCGNGSNTRFFALQGYEAYGIDISTSAIELAKAWLDSEGIAANLVAGTCLDLPYDDAFFDVVVSYGVLDHMSMDDANTTMAQIKRVLKPGGLCFITLRATNDIEFGEGTPAGRNTFILSEGYEAGLPQHFFDIDEIHGLMQEFHLLDIRRSEMLFGPELSMRNSRWQITAELPK